MESDTHCLCQQIINNPPKPWCESQSSNANVVTMNDMTYKEIKTDDKNEMTTTKTDKDKIIGKTIEEAGIQSILNFLQITTILTLKLKIILRNAAKQRYSSFNYIDCGQSKPFFQPHWLTRNQMVLRLFSPNDEPPPDFYHQT